MTASLPIGWADINPEKLVSAEWNYKKQDAQLMKKLVSNIKNNGQVESIIIRELDDGLYEVVNGNHRLEAFTTLGYNKVHCYNLGKISLEKAKQIAISTNETRFATDRSKLDSLLMDILSSEEGTADTLSFLPFKQQELDSVMEMLSDVSLDISVDDAYLFDESQDVDKTYETENYTPSVSQYNLSLYTEESFTLEEIRVVFHALGIQKNVGKITFSMDDLLRVLKAHQDYNPEQSVSTESVENSEKLDETINV